MKGVALWALGASVAFLATAGAFLMLANLGGSSAASDPIPRAEPSGDQGSGPTLMLELPKDRLEELEKAPGQRLALEVENESDEELPNVALALDVFSENTARPRTRSYEEAIEDLGAGESATVEFEIDLSPPIPAEASSATDPQTREILEIRATAPGGASAVKTAVLAP